MADLRAFQRVMSTALFRPLNTRDGLDERWEDGRPTAQVAAEFVKPNELLTSSERLEIYARSYWFRVLDGIFDDFPGLHAALGQRRFVKLATAYLAAFPSASFSLRNLGGRLPAFVAAHPELSAPYTLLAIDLARFEWAQVVAFDEAARPPLSAADSATLRLDLQPYLTLLECAFPVDDFMLAMKGRDAGLRGEASNAIISMPKASRTRPRLPRPAQTFVAVHRCDNALYYKRLEPEAFRLLAALRDGRTLSAACSSALRGADPAIDWSARIRDWFQNWQSLGWFCQRTPRRPTV